MTPGVFPLVLYRGDSYRWSFVLWADTAKTVPADLTGVVAKSQIRDKPAGATVVNMLCAVTLPNIIAMTLDATSSQSLPPAGVWDLQLTYAAGDVATVLAGVVTVTPDVTDSAAGRVLRSVA